MIQKIILSLVPVLLAILSYCLSATVAEFESYIYQKSLYNGNPKKYHELNNAPLEPSNNDNTNNDYTNNDYSDDNGKTISSLSSSSSSFFARSKHRSPHLLIEVFRNGDGSNGRYFELSDADCKLGDGSIQLLISASLNFFEKSPPKSRFHGATSSSSNSRSSSKGTAAAIDDHDGGDYDGDSEDKDRAKLKNQCDSSKQGPCSVYNEVGQPIFNCSQLRNFDKVFVVPFNRIFIWPSYHIGHKHILPHISTPVDSPIELESISLMPKIFKIKNLISDSEAAEFIDSALSLTDDGHKFGRSKTTGGTASKIISSRTSSNAFVVSASIAVKMKQRIYEVLGIYPYDSDANDGFQVVHYNLTQAYAHHFDFLDNAKRRNPDGLHFDHNYLPAENYRNSEGTNRAATVFIYLSDVEEGGETVFPDSPTYEYLTNTENTTFITKDEALLDTRAHLDASNLSHVIQSGTWEEGMVADCRHRFSVKPKKLEAILFYSQNPDGSLDPFSLHGGCPVLRGEKWAANLWIWNGKRGKSVHFESKSNALNVSFINVNLPDASLYWQEHSFGKLPFNQPFPMNTYVGHSFSIRIDNKIIKTHVMVANVTNYIVSLEDLETLNLLQPKETAINNTSAAVNVEL